VSLRRYLLETTCNPPAFADATDTSPPSTSIFGEKMVPELIQSLNGQMKRYVSDPKFDYGEWTLSDGMDNEAHFHKSLRGVPKLVNRKDFTLDKYWSKKNKEEEMRFEDPDYVKLAVTLQQKADKSFAVNDPKWDVDDIKTTMPVIRIGRDDHEYMEVNLDKLLGRHI
jgi:hypothetical protein